VTYKVRKYATLSDCGRYRYTLSRDWEPRLPQAVFVMLNPSTADAEDDDPTIRRCIAFAKAWGCGAIKVLNLFALRATKPKELYSSDDPIGPLNDWWLEKANECERNHIEPKHFVCAWGNHGGYLNRAERVCRNWANRNAPVNTSALKINKSGQPGHPLFLKGTLYPFYYGGSA